MRSHLTLPTLVLLAALVAGSAAYGRSTVVQKPWPRSALGAISLVRWNPQMKHEVSPFQRVLSWHASWRGDRWWVIGLLQSQWGKEFVGDATIIHRHVYAGTDYVERPSQRWVKRTAQRLWHLGRLYTRFTDEAAIVAAEQSLERTSGPPSYILRDSAAKLVKDSAQHVYWYFALYVQLPDGTKDVYTITGLGLSDPAEEGKYVSGYGFGSQATLDTAVPLQLQPWVQSLIIARSWTPSNF